MADLHQCVLLLQRVLHDLSQLQDRRFLTTYSLDSLNNIELAYRELVALDLIDELSVEQREGIDLVRRYLYVIRQLQLSFQLSEVSSSPTVVIVSRSQTPPLFDTWTAGRVWCTGQAKLYKERPSVWSVRDTSSIKANE